MLRCANIKLPPIDWDVIKRAAPRSNGKAKENPKKKKRKTESWTKAATNVGECIKIIALHDGSWDRKRGSETEAEKAAEITHTHCVRGNWNWNYAYAVCVPCDGETYVQRQMLTEVKYMSSPSAFSPLPCPFLYINTSINYNGIYVCICIYMRMTNLPTLFATASAETSRDETRWGCPVWAFDAAKNLPPHSYFIGHKVSVSLGHCSAML